MTGATAPSGRSWKSTGGGALRAEAASLGGAASAREAPVGAEFPMPLGPGECRGLMVTMETAIVALLRCCAGFQGSARNDGWWKVRCGLEALSATEQTSCWAADGASGKPGRLEMGVRAPQVGTFRVVTTYHSMTSRRVSPVYIAPTGQCLPQPSALRVFHVSAHPMG